MENPKPEEENIVKDSRNRFRLEIPQLKIIKNLFRLKKVNEEIKDRIFRDIRNIFRLEKEKKPIKDIILRDIRNLFENQEQKNYYKPVRVSNFWSDNYVEYESSGDRNKTLSVEE